MYVLIVQAEPFALVDVVDTVTGAPVESFKTGADGRARVQMAHEGPWNVHIYPIGGTEYVRRAMHAVAVTDPEEVLGRAVRDEDLVTLKQIVESGPDNLAQVAQEEMGKILDKRSRRKVLEAGHGFMPPLYEKPDPTEEARLRQADAARAGYPMRPIRQPADPIVRRAIAKARALARLALRGLPRRFR